MMGYTLTEIAQQLASNVKKVQIIYAFNGMGKTRLSREFKQLVAPKNIDDNTVQTELSDGKIIYYNAFTEDLFYWDNDLKLDSELKLKIHPNSFTKWILEEQGKDQQVITNFQHYTNTKIAPKFSINFSEVTFSLVQDGGSFDNIKISKGEENNFIWSIFYTLMEQVIAELNIPEPENRSTADFNDLEYIFIDDPVSSLDENHLIELAVDIAKLINASKSKVLKFIISTHNPLFYNVMYNEIGAEFGYILRRHNDGTFDLEKKMGDSNKSFSYHLFLKQTIEEAIKTKTIQKYHFMLLRNLYEKTAQFLGYPQWSDLLPDDKKLYLKRIIQFTSHSTLSNEVVAEPTEPEKQTLSLLFNHLVENNYWKEKQSDTV